MNLLEILHTPRLSELTHWLLFTTVFEFYLDLRAGDSIFISCILTFFLIFSSQRSMGELRDSPFLAFGCFYRRTGCHHHLWYWISDQLVVFAQRIVKLERVKWSLYIADRFSTIFPRWQRQGIGQCRLESGVPEISAEVPIASAIGSLKW